MSWIWWNNISGNTTRPALPAKNTAAIGSPADRLFLEPQNTMVIRSSLLKPMRVATVHVITSARHSSTASTPTSSTNRSGASWCQIPATTPSLNAAYTTTRIEPRSTTPTIRLCPVTQPTSQRRHNWPSANGTSNCNTMSPTDFSDSAPLLVDTSSAISTGEMNTPSRLDIDAAHTAAATLPLAMDVNAMDDWTVDGSTHRNS